MHPASRSPCTGPLTSLAGDCFTAWTLLKPDGPALSLPWEMCGSIGSQALPVSGQYTGDIESDRVGSRPYRFTLTR